MWSPKKINIHSIRAYKPLAIREHSTYVHLKILTQNQIISRTEENEMVKFQSSTEGGVGTPSFFTDFMPVSASGPTVSQYIHVQICSLPYSQKIDQSRKWPLLSKIEWCSC